MPVEGRTGVPEGSGLDYQWMLSAAQEAPENDLTGHLFQLAFVL